MLNTILTIVSFSELITCTINKIRVAFPFDICHCLHRQKKWNVFVMPSLLIQSNYSLCPEKDHDWLRLFSVNRTYVINSFAPGRPGCHFKTAIFNLVLLIGFFRFSNDNAPKWMPWDLTDDKSTLAQVMACCLTALSHYLSQCWPSSMSPYGVTRPQWVKSVWPGLYQKTLSSSDKVIGRSLSGVVI